MSKTTNPLKRLAGETAIYGMGTIVPRLLNYLLTPFFTRVLIKSDYAVLTDLYSWIAILLVLTTYGMETSFFRFSNKAQHKKKVYSTALGSIFSTTILFLAVILMFQGDIAAIIGYAKHPEFILFVALIVGMDALASIPFASLREQRRAFRFSSIKITGVVVNIILNFYFLWFCPMISEKNPDSLFLFFYSSNIEVGYIFISNIISSAVVLAMLLPQIFKTKLYIDFTLLKRMLRYAYPLAIIILAGMINEVADKVMLKYLLPQETLIERMELLGEYGANFKLAVLMSVFIQMFRFAAEPFFFAQAKEKNAKSVYANVMKYFIIFGWLIFLGVMLYLDILKYFIAENYHQGLFIVPILLIAKLFQGVFYNLSVWYKLTDLTKMGAYIAISGTIITLLFNLFLVPEIGYKGAAYGQLACYGSMVIISFIVGRKHYKINYPVKWIAFYSGFALLIYLVSTIVQDFEPAIKFTLNTFMLLAFITVAFVLERKKIRTNAY